MMRAAILVLLFTFSACVTYSHSVWIQTNPQAKKGEKQEIKVFFGAYESNKPDSTKKWFSDIEEFTLTVSAPDGKSTVLKATQETLFFKASFTPEQEGTYTISISHPVKDLYKGSKLSYYAFANVQVGNTSTATKQSEKLALSLLQNGIHFNQNQIITQQLLFKNAPLAKQNVTIVAPDLVSIEVQTDSKGSFSFTPKQKGIYFIEAFYEEENPGTHHNVAYKKAWHMVTQQLTSK